MSWSGKGLSKEDDHVRRQRRAGKGLWNAGEDEGICLDCHNPRSPTFDPKRYVLPDGSTTGFAFLEAKEKISHPIPAEVRGKYLELEKIEKEKARAAALAN